MGIARKLPATAADLLRVSWNRDSRARALRAAVRAAALGGEPAALVHVRSLLAEDETTVDEADTEHRTIAAYHAATSKPQHWARFLHVLTRELNPRSVVELGTAVGVSGTAIATALRGDAHLWTADINATASGAADRTFQAAGVKDSVSRVIGDFDEVLEPMLADASPVSLLFIDGNHQEDPTWFYFETSIQYLADSAVIVFDDIHWSAGMSRCWRRIRRDKRVSWSVDLGGLGVVAI